MDEITEREIVEAAEAYAQKRQSPPRLATTIFGSVMVDGPFADDFLDFKWSFHDHRDGESARFRAAGLEAYVQDCDGDASYWELRDVRKRRSESLLASGGDHSNNPIYHFWKCLVDAEVAIRNEASARKRAYAALRAARKVRQ
jgi:hypothetical protein